MAHYAHANATEGGTQKGIVNIENKEDFEIENLEMKLISLFF